jgi:hypothetical protein
MSRSFRQAAGESDSRRNTRIIMRATLQQRAADS